MITVPFDGRVLVVSGVTEIVVEAVVRGNCAMKWSDFRHFINRMRFDDPTARCAFVHVTICQCARIISF